MLLLIMPPLDEEIGGFSDKNNFELDKFTSDHKVPLVFLLVGLILSGLGIILYKSETLKGGDRVEVISAVNVPTVVEKEIVVEIAGEVMKPGVYKLSEGARVEDLLITSGGFSANADREWLQKYVNRASKLIDGQKIYIPKEGEQTTEGTANNLGGIKVDQEVLGAVNDDLVNINAASLNQLDALPGIGQVYGQKIIEHRPYSTIEELVSKGAINQSVFEKIKDRVKVF